MATYSGDRTELAGLHVGRYDHLHGVGDGTVTGTVKTKSTPSNIPTLCLVRLYRDQDGLLIKAQWTDPATGAYSFTSVSMGYTYTVIAFDHTLNFRAVIADRIAPVEVTP